MPTPLAHAIAGVAAGWLVAGRPRFVEDRDVPGRARVRPDAKRPPAGSQPGGRTTRVIAMGRLGTVGRDTVLFAVLGMLPDVDFLWGMHNMHTHSIGAALLAGLVVSLVVNRYRARLGLAATAAYGSHVLLDWLGRDASPPIGIMALWPFSTDHYLSDLQVFMAVMRRIEQPEFIRHNLTALAWELVILVPILALVWVWRRKGPSEHLEAPRDHSRSV